MEETKHTATDPEYGHEPDDLNARKIALLGAGLLIMIGVVLAIMGGMFEFLGTRLQYGQAPSELAVGQTLPPTPRLQTTPARSLKATRAGEDVLLESYGWVDKQAGVVRIPIDRAIEVLALKGLPVRAQNTAGPPAKEKKPK